MDLTLIARSLQWRPACVTIAPSLSGWTFIKSRSLPPTLWMPQSQKILATSAFLQRDLDRLCQRMRSKAATVRFVYEAGPCGYAVYRSLTGKGFDCTVCAPSLIARKPGDRVKTDQRDARKLVRALRMNDLSAVHVPDTTDEAFRDLVRVWSAARADLTKARQRLKSFLLVRCALCRHRQLE